MTHVTARRRMPPPHLLQRIAQSTSAAEFSATFPFVRHAVPSYLNQAGFNFSDFNHILDLGCGVGRFLFAFEEALAPHQKLWGCEVHPECARWCQENIEFAEVAHNQIDPPLPYDDEQFDLVYASSVFTHLSLEMQFRWAWEIHRVLRPGAVLFVTTHGPVFFPQLHRSRDGSRVDELSSLLKELGRFIVRAFHKGSRFDQLYSFGDDGLFGYLTYPSGEGLDQGQIQVASAHTSAFFREQFSGFEVVKRFPQSTMAAGQDLYIIRRPEHGRSIERPIVCPPQAWSWSQDAADSATTTPIELTFHLAGHQEFRVYPTVEPKGRYATRFLIEIFAGERLLASQKCGFANGSVLGRQHFGTMLIPVPSYNGTVRVRLSTAVTDRGNLPANATPRVAWCFPHFC
jgi:SAM-dependent methyltransferase